MDVQLPQMFFTFQIDSNMYVKFISLDCVVLGDLIHDKIFL